MEKEVLRPITWSSNCMEIPRIIKIKCLCHQEFPQLNLLISNERISYKELRIYKFILIYFGNIKTK